MKIKVFQTLIILATLLSIMAACGKSVSTKESQTSETVTESTVIFKQTEPAVRQPTLQVLSDAFKAVGITNWDGSYKNLTFEQRTALEQYFANERKENIRFTDEGVLYADLSKIPLSESWAENGILKLAPEPGFGAVFTSWVEQKAVSVSFAEVPEAVIANYIAEVKAAGFSHVTAESTSVCCGLVFEADNSNGIKIALASKFAGTQPVTTIRVSIP